MQEFPKRVGIPIRNPEETQRTIPGGMMNCCRTDVQISEVICGAIFKGFFLRNPCILRGIPD